MCVQFRFSAEPEMSASPEAIRTVFLRGRKDTDSPSISASKLRLRTLFRRLICKFPVSSGLGSRKLALVRSLRRAYSR
jgi:hypothetical protein